MNTVENPAMIIDAMSKGDRTRLHRITKAAETLAKRIGLSLHDIGDLTVEYAARPQGGARVGAGRPSKWVRSTGNSLFALPVRLIAEQVLAQSREGLCIDDREAFTRATNDKFKPKAGLLFEEYQNPLTKPTEGEVRRRARCRSARAEARKNQISVS